MVAVNARMQHERNYDDAELAKRKLKRLDIDPTNIEMGWVMDFCAQGLRNIIMGIGGRMDGFLMQSKFGITVSSELMAILSIVRDSKRSDVRGSVRLSWPMIRKANPSPLQTLKWQEPCVPGCAIPSIQH